MLKALSGEIRPLRNCDHEGIVYKTYIPIHTLKDYLDQLLSMMSSYEEECHRDMDEGLRDEEFEPTIDEWMQNVMLQTDQDQEDDGNRVTLMTVHSAKGLEYDYV